MAWVFRELDRFYAPGYHWPRDVVAEPEGDVDLDAYIALFESRGYVRCDSGDLEDGFLKIAIYDRHGAFHHVAKQLPNGEWSSKLGVAHDLRHERLDALEGSTVYFDNATASVFMRRIHDPHTESFQLELTGLV